MSVAHCIHVYVGDVCTRMYVSQWCLRVYDVYVRESTSVINPRACVGAGCVCLRMLVCRYACVVVSTGPRAEAWCLLIHAEASLSVSLCMVVSAHALR